MHRERLDVVPDSTTGTLRRQARRRDPRRSRLDPHDRQACSEPRRVATQAKGAFEDTRSVPARPGIATPEPCGREACLPTSRGRSTITPRGFAARSLASSDRLARRGCGRHARLGPEPGGSPSVRECRDPRRPGSEWVPRRWRRTSSPTPRTRSTARLTKKRSNATSRASTAFAGTKDRFSAGRRSVRGCRPRG